jgi:hypothetical protein
MLWSGMSRSDWVTPAMARVLLVIALLTAGSGCECGTRERPRDAATGLDGGAPAADGARPVDDGSLPLDALVPDGSSGECETTETRCGAACADLRADPLHCGRCDLACPEPENGFAICTRGACGVECDRGYLQTDGRCEPSTTPPPHPIAPLSYSRTTTLRPTFSWTLEPELHGAEVEVCYDRACTMPIATFAATGTEVTASSDLPAETVYYRLWGRIGERIATLPGATREIRPLARTSEVRSAYQTMVDVDADGFADLLAVARPVGGAFEIRIHRGGPSGVSTTPASTLSGEGITLDGPVRAIGDIDGDGISEVAANVCAGGPPCARATYVWRVDLATSGAFPSAWTPSGGAFWRPFTGGDIDGDGFHDLIVTSGALGSDTTECFDVYPGGAPGLVTGYSAFRRCGTRGNTFAWTLDATGDLDGDGDVDLAVGRQGSIAIYFQGDDGPSDEDVALLGVGAFDPGFGRSFVASSDVNGDGFADVVAGGRELGRAFVFFGSALGLEALPSQTVPVSPERSDEAHVVALGDVNGDGFDDIALTALAIAATLPIDVHFGSATGLAAAPHRTFLGGAIAGPGDFDADGYDDVAIRVSTGVAIHHGGPSGLEASPSTLLEDAALAYALGER